jgi:diguanylate cyclase (GGDEF)-like protein
MLWPLGVVLLDLDHFKNVNVNVNVNDTFGHARGDEVLAAVGVALQSTVRESDFVGRYGGEEFVMLLPDTAREAASQVAERVRAAIADIRVLEPDSSVTASFGIAVFPDDAPDAARLIRNADRALYPAKANGRNRVEVFTLKPFPEAERKDAEAIDPAEGTIPTGR